MSALEEYLANTRFTRFVVINVLWPIGCFIGHHQWEYYANKDRNFICLRCGREGD